ncbi:MAG: magnesium/cobalt transporter CorA [Nitrospirae bacterium]|nr:MAG: magnesium/cobalt transporter CorA [Nitrospirota bacterium]
MRASSKRSKKTGLPPGTLVHIGKKRTDTARISVIDYDETRFSEQTIDNCEQCVPFKEGPAVTWIDVDGIHQEKLLSQLGDCYGLHPLMLEDILNTEQRPKLEDYSEYLYIVLKMFYVDDKSGGIITEQISLVLGKNFVLSFQEGLEGDVFNTVREHLRNPVSRIRKMGADYLAYSLIDAVVDNYFVILEKVGERVESIEEALVGQPTPATLQSIHHLKRDLIFLRKSVWPLREVVSGLQRGESQLVNKNTLFYLRDVYDHTIQVIDTIESFRDMVSGMLEIYLSSVSNRLNSIMKVLTIITTIFMPLTFIAGVYGMNFKHMPEIEWTWGYPLILLVMVMIAASMLAFFRKKDWL